MEKARVVAEYKGAYKIKAEKLYRRRQDLLFFRGHANIATVRIFKKQAVQFYKQ